MDADELKRSVLGSPLLRNSLISADQRAAAVVIYYAREGHAFRHKQEFVLNLRDVIRTAAIGQSVEVAITGAPVIGDAAQDRNNRDLSTVVPAMILIIAGITYVLFRSWSLALLPLLVVGVAAIWAFALMSITGWAMSMLSIILIPLVLAVGVGHSIHITTRYGRELQRETPPDVAITQSVSAIVRPCFFTAITTVAGLLSLLISDIGPVREFAITAAVGVFAAFVLSITLLPILLYFVRPRMSPDRSASGRTGLRVLRSLLNIGHRRPRSVLMLASATLGGSLLLASQVESGLDAMSWIPRGDPVRVATERIDNTFGGALSLEFLVASDGAVSDPETLGRIEDFQEWLVANTTVARTVSVADLVKEAARVARDAGDEGYALPRTKVVTRSLLDSLQRSGELWLTADESLARISARVPMASAQTLVDELPDIEERLRQQFGGTALSVAMTGQAFLAGRMQVNLLESQVESFAVALLAVSLAMFALLGSARLGLVAMVPNLLPVILGLAAMTVLGIPLNPATVMVTAVALGIVVDDTVHLMSAVKREIRHKTSISAAVRASILDVGRPVLVTSLLLTTGFLTLVLGSYLPTRQIGALIAFIAAAALVTDLLLLPVLVSRLRVVAFTEER